MTRRFGSGVAPSCPERRHRSESSVVLCCLNDEPCVKESYGQCNTYDDWLFEEKQKEVDKAEKSCIKDGTRESCNGCKHYASCWT